MCVVEGDLCVTWATVLSRRYQTVGFGFWGYRASRACDCAAGCVCECLLLCGECMYQSAATAFWCNINRCLPASPGALRHLGEFVYDQLITQSKHTSIVIVSRTRERKWFHPFFPEATFYILTACWIYLIERFKNLSHYNLNMREFYGAVVDLTRFWKWRKNDNGISRFVLQIKNLQMCCWHL